MKLKFLYLVLLISMLLTALPTQTFAMSNQQINCNDGFDHHDLSTNPYASRITSGRVWRNLLTQSIIGAVWIKECGKYLIYIVRNGTFRSAFLVNQGYLNSQIAGFKATTWANVRLINWLFFIIVPCPGTWNTLPPCPNGETS